MNKINGSRKKPEGWVFDNIRRGERYNMLTILLSKKKATIQTYFGRNDLDIMDSTDILYYCSKSDILTKWRPKGSKNKTAK